MMYLNASLHNLLFSENRKQNLNSVTFIKRKPTDNGKDKLP